MDKKIRFTNKIPQWAFRKTLEGAQSDNLEERHPELRPDGLLANAVKKTASKKDENKLIEDIEKMVSMSPTLKRAMTENTDIKRAHVNSDEAILESMNTKQNIDTMSPNAVRKAYSVENTENGHSSYASKLPGGLGLFDNKKFSSCDSLIEKLSQLSKKCIKDKKAENNEYLNKKTASTTDEILEQQKGRKLSDSFDQNTLMYSAQFGSSNQVSDRPDVNISLKKVANVNGDMSAELKDFSKIISKYQTKKILSQFSNKNNWLAEADKNIKEKLEQASEQAKKIVKDKDKEKDTARNTKVTFAQLSEVMNRKSEISDTKHENVTQAKNRLNQIKEKRTEKEQITVADISKPTSNVWERTLQILSGKKK